MRLKMVRKHIKDQQKREKAGNITKTIEKLRKQRGGIHEIVFC